MNSENSGTYNTGVSLSGFTTLAFVILKLCAVIDWSWWWVLAPTWIPIAIALAIVCVVGVTALIAYFTIGEND